MGPSCCLSSKQSPSHFLACLPALVYSCFIPQGAVSLADTTLMVNPLPHPRRVSVHSCSSLSVALSYSKFVYPFAHLGFHWLLGIMWYRCIVLVWTCIFIPLGFSDGRGGSSVSGVLRNYRLSSTAGATARLLRVCRMSAWFHGQSPRC